ncbi:MAG TPA: PKD domain-containing protein [Longimicrobiales bacterium]|nr:PKD domain-containing protein [Longimicrobiales bacterium]
MHRSSTSFLAVTLAAFSAAACMDNRPQPLEPAQQLDAAPVAVRASPNIIAVQNRHTPDLMRRDGIVGTGVRVSASGESIVVYAVTPNHAAAARLPRRLEGYDVDVVATGRIDAVRAMPTERSRPAPSGFSVGHPDITAGTIGAKVKDGSGNVYILSNNHVLANSNNASIGDATLQPGPFDGGTSADQIGTLADFQPIVMGGSSNTMDAAIALVNGSDLLGRTPDDAYGAPGTTVYGGGLLNKGVQKFGRTTGHTTGTVTETNVTVSVCYVPRGMFSCAEAATFTGQIGISPGSFSAGGDSGSLIVTNDTNKQLVGLLYAGSDTRTLANPIGPVLQRFGVSIDVSEGDGGTVDPPPTGDDTTAPTAAFSYSCNRADCSFSDQSTDNVGVTARSWSGAFSSTQASPSHTFPAAGNYTVTLTVTDAVGNSDATSQTVNCAVKGRWLRCS